MPRKWPGESVQAGLEGEVWSAGVKLVPVDKDLGTQPSPALSKVVTGGLWNNLVSNVETVHTNVLCLSTTAHKCFKGVDVMLDGLEYKLSVLKALIGDRLVSLGTTTLFQVVEDLYIQVHRFKKLYSSSTTVPSFQFGNQFLALGTCIQSLEGHLKKLLPTLSGVVGTEVHQLLQQELFSTSSSFQQNSAQPTLQFLQAWLLDPNHPGDRLDATLRQTEQRLNGVEIALKQGVSGSSANTTAPMPSGPFNWSTTGTVPVAGTTVAGLMTSTVLGSAPSTFPTPSVVARVDIVGLAKEVKQLCTEVSAINNQLELEAVEILTEMFKSKSECATWLQVNNAKSSAYLVVDAILFLSLCTCDAHESEQDVANQWATSIKVQDSNTYQTAFIGSYSLKVPPLLGKGVNVDSTRATRTLAAVPTFEDFHPGGVKEGVKERLMYYIKDGLKTMEALLIDTFN
ncbi:hypothetical protein ACA910_021698 [Epithemia clementina (nom. ined.)]